MNGQPVASGGSVAAPTRQITVKAVVPRVSEGPYRIDSYPKLEVWNPNAAQIPGDGYEEDPLAGILFFRRVNYDSATNTYNLEGTLNLAGTGTSLTLYWDLFEGAPIVTTYLTVPASPPAPPLPPAASTLAAVAAVCSLVVGVALSWFGAR